MMSFELHGGVDAAESFMHAATLPIIAPSLGGVESLVTRPAMTSHSGMSVTDRQKLGITDGLIRFSVGIEGTDDLIEDFKQALGELLVGPRTNNSGRTTCRTCNPGKKEVDFTSRS